MSVINNPILPPNEGYIEVIDANGNHVYAPTADTIARQNLEKLLLEVQHAQAEQTQVVDTLIGINSEEVTA